MAKFTLTLEDDFDFRLIAVCSHAKDYRLSWFLSQTLVLDLQKKEDLEMQKKGELYKFSFYAFEKEEDQLEYYLIGNKCMNSQLIPERKQVDYFFMIKGPVQDQNIKEIIQEINGISVVLTAYEEDVYDLKSRQNLIF